MSKRQLTTLAVGLALVLSVMAPAVAAGGAAVQDDGELDVSVSQTGDGVAFVSVSGANWTAADEGTVNVTVDDENKTYDGAGTYEIDEDDEAFKLPSPGEDVNVSIEVTVGDQTANTTALLTADELEVSVSQDDETGAATVSVESGVVDLDDGTVEVTTVDENASYDGTGTYDITVGDESTEGTVDLPAPNETVEVSVTATAGTLNETTTATLEAPGDENETEESSIELDVEEADDGSATVYVSGTNVTVDNGTVTVATLDENVTYEGTGTYDITNGTVDLPAPNETVDVSITAEVDGLSASVTGTLEAPDDENETDAANETANATPFGQLVTEFIAGLNETDGGIGPQVATFVVENNPGNAPDHAGPPEWKTNESVNKTAGPPEGVGPNDGNESETADSEDKGPDGDQGPPEDKGPDGDQGPPEDKGPDGDQGPPEDKGPDGDQGPPEDKGPDKDDDDEEDSEDAEDDRGSNGSNGNAGGNGGGNGNAGGNGGGNGNAGGGPP